MARANSPGLEILSLLSGRAMLAEPSSWSLWAGGGGGLPLGRKRVTGPAGPGSLCRMTRQPVWAAGSRSHPLRQIREKAGWFMI